MKKYLFLLLISLLPSMMVAQGAGGQITRPAKKTQPVKKVSQPTKKPTAKPATEAAGYDVTIISNVPSATLYIDGNMNGIASGSRFLKTGQHTVKLVASGYNDLTKTITVSSKSKSFTLNMTQSGSSTVNNSYQSSSNSSGGIKQFFPIWGMTLNETTWSQAEALGYNVKIWRDGPDRTTDVNRVSFWDHDGVGYFTSIYWTHADSDFPNEWKSKGFSWDNSYDRWISVFSNLGFSINVKEQPTTKEYSGRNTLSANFVATSMDKTLEFDMNFNYGESGYLTSSPKSLYGITIRAKGNSANANISNNTPTYSASSSGTSTVSLKDILSKPLGKINCAHTKDSYSSLKNSFSSVYRFQDSSDNNYWHLVISRDDNTSLSSFQYRGASLERYFVIIDKDPNSNLIRRFGYNFEISTSSGIDPYSILDQIVGDLNSLGIPISYERINERYRKAEGKYGGYSGTSYSISLTEYSTTWQISISQWEWR